MTPARRGPARRTWLILAGVIAAHLLITFLAVAPQLSPRIMGTEVTLKVAPLDPIEPFRGAYVSLDYPDLPDPLGERGTEDLSTGFIPLTRDGEVWVGGPVQGTQPEDGLFLRCHEPRWQRTCGIESWFVGQSRAAQIERAMRDGEALATVRIDRWGNAAIVDLTPPVTE
ncbi:MAG: GDYXXLXY domain-containing protein [Actinomycetia bacterium]|nr:GDYXXLXY domain-containing protein [Actinomycetes bacterium]